MKFSTWGLALLAAAGFLASTDQATARANAADIKKACAPGLDPQPEGSTWSKGLNPAYGQLTPTTLAGAQVVSAGEGRCIIDKFPDVSVFAILDDAKIVPRSIPMSWAAVATEEANIQARVEQVAAAATGGDKAQPILVYCHHEQCFMSYNVATRLIRAGYRSVYWMRTGLLEWRNAAFPMVAREDRALLSVRGRATADFARSLPDCESSVRAELLMDSYIDYYVLDHGSVEAYKRPSEYSYPKTDPRGEWMKSAAGQKDNAAYCMGRHVPIPDYIEQIAPKYKSEFDAAVSAARPRWAKQFAVTEATYRQVADTFDRDPKAYLMQARLAPMLDTTSLAATLQIVRSMPSFEARCGVLSDTDYPSSYTKAEYDRRLALVQRRFDCMAQWFKEVPAVELPGAKDFALAAHWVKRARPYVCSIRQQAACLPDADWQRIAAIASEANANAVADAYRTASIRMRPVLPTTEELRLSEWVTRAGYMENGKFTPRR